jgi:hypothetical protein
MYSYYHYPLQKRNIQYPNLPRRKQVSFKVNTAKSAQRLPGTSPVVCEPCRWKKLIFGRRRSHTYVTICVEEIHYNRNYYFFLLHNTWEHHILCVDPILKKKVKSLKVGVLIFSSSDIFECYVTKSELAVQKINFKNFR